MPRIKSIVPYVSLIAPLLAGGSCMDRTVASIEPVPVIEERVDFEVDENRDVDLLFVIDNSNSMEREQTSLTEKFNTLITTLAEHPDGLPSIRIAVVSTDLGVGAQGNVCSNNGDGGLFQGSQCPGLDGSFLESIALEDGGRSNNFTGELRDVFSCMATLGTGGCGFEQPLEATRRALSQPQAEGFLREHAYLAVIIVTDEDDCSVRDNAMFDGTRQDLGTHLGPAKSFRCFEFGVECEGDDPRAIGSHSDCVPRSNSEFLYEVDEYVQFLYGVKEFPKQVLVATIAGALDPVKVISKFDSQSNLDYLALDFSCTEQDAEAVPPIRLAAFLNGFPEKSRQSTSICDEDLSSALDKIGNLINERTSPCIEGALADLDPQEAGLQPDCIISVTAPSEEELRLEGCSNVDAPEESTKLPCFTLLEDAACVERGTATGLSPKVYYADGFTVAPGTVARASCLIE